jgi:hypothetical protein
MSPDDITALVGALVAVASMLGGGLAWMVRRMDAREDERRGREQQLIELVVATNQQFKPNSGKSMADSISAIHERLERQDRGQLHILERLDRMDGRFDEAIRAGEREHRSIRQWITNAFGTAGIIDNDET